ncbi:hypothetical protein [Mesoaciditoga lauensis]|uniref:hypothetical protein n=1 Tax=Mesoaciditoga lauensis TaxID=1495039 RepID=UPI00056C0CF7|nr:hypothetical protein [Mesoaciditoga lauensis]
MLDILESLANAWRNDFSEPMLGIVDSITSGRYNVVLIDSNTIVKNLRSSVSANVGDIVVLNYINGRNGEMEITAKSSLNA